ncbi:MAG: TIGR03086 family metal-binding protein [Actinomycetota bacterium]|nr:TIGR03086 family metal-binding protein [Actinomycetota bacterium]
MTTSAQTPSATAPASPPTPATPAAAAASATSATSGGPPDPRPFLARALDQVGLLVRGLTPDDLDRPTPCPEYTVRGLLGHLVAVEARLAHIVTGGQPFDLPSVVEGVADDGWAAAWQAGRRRLDTVLADDAVLEGTIAHPARVMPARLALFAYVSEVAVHGWDLAMAIGRRDVLDESLAAVVLGPVQGALPNHPRGGDVPFAEVVAVGSEATPYDRLVAWMGRHP